MEENRLLFVQVPTNRQIKRVIDLTARFVASEGLEFEKAIAERERRNPKFAFMTNLNSPNGIYYRWRAYAYAMNEGDRVWHEKPFQLFSQSNVWIVPPIAPANLYPGSSLYHPPGTQLILDDEIGFHRVASNVIKLPPNCPASYLKPILPYLQHLSQAKLSLDMENSWIKVSKCSLDRIQGVKDEIETVLQDRDQTEKIYDEIDTNKLHIFIDYSNTVIGSKILFNPLAKYSSVSKDYLISLIPAELDLLICHGRKAVERHIYGSIQPNEQDGTQQSTWESLGYHAGFSVRRRKYAGEEFVDDALIAQINGSLLKYRSPRESPHTLVLLTGDGNGNYGRVSFYESVMNALQAGWKVELWTWQASIHHKYLNLVNTCEKADQFVIYFLDHWREMITSRPAAARG